MSKIVNSIIFWYIRHFVVHPYCTTHKIVMEAEGRLSGIGVFGKVNGVQFVCPEGDEGGIKWRDGSYRVLEADEAMTYQDKKMDILHRFHGRVFLDGETPNMDYVEQASQAIDELVKEMVIGSGELHVSHVCPQDSIPCREWRARSALRHEQRQVIDKGEKDE